VLRRVVIREDLLDALAGRRHPRNRYPARQPLPGQSGLQISKPDPR
jgi:hypothetical protein